ncbi:PP2C family protein-serine/threonine phosphatase [Yinghuangia sp. YIM S09857]|uniref:PP2C family protein-serine/threonine phosphatase n=1 Tax=Yinghuangia sp. YIM S09857 TaxID=3436929 RepID=UPI003F53081C
MFSSRHDEGSASGNPLVQIARWAPIGLLTMAVAVDVVTPGTQRFDRYLAAAPALAAATWGVVGTVTIGAFACLLQILLGYDRGSHYQAPAFNSMVVIAVVTLAAAYASHVRQRQERDLSDVRAVAETAQSMVLRPLPRHLDDVDLDVLYVAAQAQARIGGDFYEALRTEYGVRLVLGDVQGKGLPAVEVASVLLGSFREAAYDAPDLAALVARMELSMARYTQQPPVSDASERFATTLLMEIPEGRPVARVLNMGHPAPLLMRGRAVSAVEPVSPLLPVNLSGLAEGAADAPDAYAVETVPFTPGDRLLLYTDGVSETRGADGSFYPLAARVRGWITESPADLLELLRVDLAEFGASPGDDDVAALVVRRHP